MNIHPVPPLIKSCTNHKDCVSCATKDCFWCPKRHQHVKRKAANAPKH